ALEGLGHPGDLDGIAVLFEVDVVDQAGPGRVAVPAGGALVDVGAGVALAGHDVARHHAAAVARIHLQVGGLRHGDDAQGGAAGQVPGGRSLGPPPGVDEHDRLTWRAERQLEPRGLKRPVGAAGQLLDRRLVGDVPDPVLEDRGAVRVVADLEDVDGVLGRRLLRPGVGGGVDGGRDVGPAGVLALAPALCPGVPLGPAHVAGRAAAAPVLVPAAAAVLA